MVGSFLSMTNVNNTKQRLIDTEALSECSELRWCAQEANLCQLHGELIET